MDTSHQTITLQTPEKGLVTVTDQVRSAIAIDEGLCLVFCPHTTAHLVINEEEEGLEQDLIDAYDRIFPPDQEYRHNEGHDANADSHLKNVAIGADHTLPVEDGQLRLGTWQDIMLFETDGPRTRTVEVHCLGR